MVGKSQGRKWKKKLASGITKESKVGKLTIDMRVDDENKDFEWNHSLPNYLVLFVYRSFRSVILSDEDVKG